MTKEFDWVVVGAGIYGLYSALSLARKGLQVVVLEKEAEAFTQGSYVNQARVHNGYHYPRSYSTAKKTAQYFDRFVRDYDFAINKSFKKIYALAKNYSYSSGEDFIRFCQNVGIRCDEVPVSAFFSKDEVEAAFETDEYAFDAWAIRNYFLQELSRLDNCSIQYLAPVSRVETDSESFTLEAGEHSYQAPNVLNATYANINQIIELFGFEKFAIKYEWCEVILCEVNDYLKEVGLTVMDGPFFSIMPFGLPDKNLHSLTSVTFTPHKTAKGSVSGFADLPKSNYPSAWSYMFNLSKKYLNQKVKFQYKSSLYTTKPILLSSEIDDSRPTVIVTHSKKPTFISVLSGKINTIYDLDAIFNSL